MTTAQLKKALAEAKDNPNAFDGLQAQIDLLVAVITKK